MLMLSFTKYRATHQNQLQECLEKFRYANSDIKFSLWATLFSLTFIQVKACKTAANFNPGSQDRENDIIHIYSRNSSSNFDNQCRSHFFVEKIDYTEKTASSHFLRG